jgi:hypothetical protein
MSIVQSGAVVVAFTRIDAVLARVGAKAMGPTLLPARVDVAWYTGSCFVAIDPGGGDVGCVGFEVTGKLQKWAALCKTPIFVKILTKMRTYEASEMESFPSTPNFRQLVSLATIVSIPG